MYFGKIEPNSARHHPVCGRFSFPRGVMLTLLNVLNDQIDPATGRVTPLGWSIVIGLNLAAFGGAVAGLAAAIIGV